MAIRISKNRVALQNIPLHLSKGSTLSAAATVDLGLATGNYLHISGSTGPITSFGVTPAGSMYTLIFDATPTITFNASTMILNTGGSSFTATAGDRALLLSEGAGSYIVSILKKDGTSLVSTSATNTNGVVAVSASRSLLSSDDAKTLTVSSAADIVLTVPSGLPAGFGCAIYQSSSGAAIINGSGTTITANTSGNTKTGGAGKMTALIQTATNSYSFSGSTA